MPYIYGPTAGPLWGNAILTRYPILEFREVDLPPRDLQLLRGFLWARLDLGGGQELQVINTHYHHREEEGEIRVRQSQALIEFMGGVGRTVVMGDLNARPSELEIVMLRDAGLVDALAGVVPGYTSPSDDPEKRIDYILVSPEFTVTDVVIPNSTASDHRPVVATVSE